MTNSLFLHPASSLVLVADVAEVPWGFWKYVLWLLPSLALTGLLLPAVKPASFTWSMRIGLLLAVFLGVGHAPVSWLVGTKLTHMVVLVILTRTHLRAWYQLLPDVATKIGHTGYLHTLIGTMVSLYALTKGGGSDEAIIQAVAPIGSALVTSIIGWWASKEFHSYHAQEEEKKEGSRQAAEVKSITSQARIVGEEVAAAVERRAEARQQAMPPGQITGPLTTEQVTLISGAVAAIAQHQPALLMAAESLKDFAERAEQFQQQMESCLAHLKALDEILKTAPEVMSEMDKLLAQLKTKETTEFLAAA